MKLKVRLVVLFVGIYFLLQTAAFMFVYLSYADFREEEFFGRLREKALTTARLLIQVKEVDKDMLRIIDRNTINKLYNEKVLIFNAQDSLIYSSIQDKVIDYDMALITQIRKEGEVKYIDGDHEILGINYTEGGVDDVVLASAYDTYGKRKLVNLFQTIAFSLAVGAFMIFLASNYYIRQVFKPIETLNNAMTLITANSLNEHLPVQKKNDELASIAVNFNQMLDRLERAFEIQRTFVQQASHELKTPVALLISQVENALNKNLTSEEHVALLHSLQDEHTKLARLISSLLMLNRLHSQPENIPMETVRIDDALFSSVDELKLAHPDLSVDVDFDTLPTTEAELLVKGNMILLKTCIANLLENCYKYSLEHKAFVRISISSQQVALNFINSGETIALEDRHKLFTPFFRAKNSEMTKGHGLGLSIVKQIVDVHRGEIQYYITPQGLNCMSVILNTIK